MSVEFRLFGFAHLGILGSVPAVAGALAVFTRRRPEFARGVAIGLSGLLATNELIWYGYRLHSEGWRFPEGLPLELCDLTLWLTVASLLTRRPGIFEFAYLAGAGGSIMALFMPDLWAPFVSYPTLYFFLAHGGVVISLLFLVWAGMARPRPGCVWRVLGLTNAYAALVGIFNAIFHTNYMYLCSKPNSASLLDFFGPWPYYLIGGEMVAVVVFSLLWLPLKRTAALTLQGTSLTGSNS